MFSIKSKLLAGFLATAMAVTAIGTIAFVSAENPADPKLTDKFVLAQDFEAIPKDTVVTDFTVKEGVGVGDPASKAAVTTLITTGKNAYAMEIPEALRFAPGTGATEMWFNFNTNGVKLEKGWIIITDESGDTFSPDNTASDPGEFYQQAADGSWITQSYQSGDSGCYINWTGTGYARIKISDLGTLFDVTKKIAKIEITIKDRIDNDDAGTVYPDNTSIIIDNFGFSGATLQSEISVADFLGKDYSDMEQSSTKVMLEDFNDLAKDSVVADGAWNGWPSPASENATKLRKISANGWNGTNALTFYSPTVAGTGGQYNVYGNGSYFTFNNTDFAGKDLNYFEAWVDFSKVEFRKISFK
ncbi:MAG: hypothetical protein RR483_05310, partial [Clostridia bacterium]